MIGFDTNEEEAGRKVQNKKMGGPAARGHRRFETSKLEKDDRRQRTVERYSKKVIHEIIYHRNAITGVEVMQVNIICPNISNNVCLCGRVFYR